MHDASPRSDTKPLTPLMGRRATPRLGTLNTFRRQRQTGALVPLSAAGGSQLAWVPPRAFCTTGCRPGGSVCAACRSRSARPLPGGFAFPHWSARTPSATPNRNYPNPSPCAPILLRTTLAPDAGPLPRRHLLRLAPRAGPPALWRRGGRLCRGGRRATRPWGS